MGCSMRIAREDELDGDHQTRGDGQESHPDGAADSALERMPAAGPAGVVPAPGVRPGPPASGRPTPGDGRPRGRSAPEGDSAPLRGEAADRDAAPAGRLPPALSIVAAGHMLSPPREIAASTAAAKILFTRDDLDTTYVSGRRGVMVLSLVEDGTSYRVGRYDVETGEWRILSKGWPRFGNALAFACTVVS